MIVRLIWVEIVMICDGSGEYDRRENFWGQVAFISGRCVQVLGQSEAFAGEFGRLGMILRHLLSICDDYGELK